MESDVIVIGGGPAGATTALLLARAGCAVTVVEQSAFPRRKVCGEYLSGTNWPLLQELGIADAFHRLAGPEVRRVAVLAGRYMSTAPLPRPDRWGRGLGREALDTLLLDRARDEGAHVLQPWKCIDLEPVDGGVRVTARHRQAGTTETLTARVAVAAHGSWERGRLPSQSQRRPPRPSDLLGFKAHFRHASLPEDLMPLLSFDGGYGGMVTCDKGRTSLSCCIRRDRLEALARPRGSSAGEAVLEHILTSSPVIGEVLRGAELQDGWLSAGPLRPGIRLPARDGLLRVGNAAGESHPVIAEGISMAMQSGWLLAGRLLRWRDSLGDAEFLPRLQKDYAAAWKRSFAGRLRVAAGAAHWAMHPALVAPTNRVFRSCPLLLTLAARASGKTRLVVR